MVDNKWLITALRDFDPATALWRAIELDAAAKAIAFAKVNGRILDLGCGEGNIYASLFEKKFINIGLDNYLPLLSQARDNRIYKYLTLADGRKMPFKPESFSLIFSNSVIEHINNIDSLLTEISQIVKPGGFFIFTVPNDKFGDYLFFYRVFNKFGLRRLAEWYKSKRILLLNHYNLFSLDGWNRKLAPLGFEIVYSKHYISKEILSSWDLIAAIQFVWMKILFFTKRLPGNKLYQWLFKKLYLKYEYNNPQGAALVVVAKKL